MFSGPLLSVFLIVMVDVLGLTIMIPLLPFYAERMGATPTQVGWLLGIYAACQLVSGPVLGRWSDTMGRKPLLLASQLGTCIGFIITAFAPTLWVLFLARAIDGLTAGNLSIAQAYIADVTRPEDRAKSFGLIGIAFGLGFLVGPAVSGMLAGVDYRLPIFAAAALSATSIAATWFLLPAATPVAAGTPRRLSLFDWRSSARYFQQPMLATRLYQFGLFGLGFAMFAAGMPLVLERRLTWDGRPFGPQEVGYAWALAGLFGLVWQGPAMGGLVRRFGESRLSQVGFVGYLVGYACLAFTHSIPMLVLATAALSMGSLVRPTLTSLITHVVPRDEQGEVMGLLQSINSVSLIVGPVMAGYLIEHGWLTAWGLAAAATAALGLAFASSRTHGQSLETAELASARGGEG